MSKILEDFCRAVLNALESGEESKWFDKHFGLCRNAVFYDSYAFNRPTRPTFYALKDALGSGSEYPFNDDKDFLYQNESRNGVLYKNKKRLAFLREHANIDSE